MAKKIELNEENARKYAPIITAKCVILSIISFVFLLVPIMGESIFGMIFGILEGNSIDVHFIICLIYGALIVWNIISSWRKVILFKDKTSINTDSTAEILQSPFVKMMVNDIKGNIMLFLHLIFYMYLLFSNMDSIEFSEFLQYMIVFFVYYIVAVTFMLKLGKVTRSLNELSISANMRILNSTESEKMGVDVNKVSKETPKASMKEEKANVDALLKYKKLYDSGAITEEEYNAKKQELLNK